MDELVRDCEYESMRLPFENGALATTQQEFDELEELLNGRDDESYGSSPTTPPSAVMSSSPPISIPMSPTTGAYRPKVRIANYHVRSLPEELVTRAATRRLSQNRAARVRAELDTPPPFSNSCPM